MAKKEKKPTTDEHFVPQVYLRGFSKDDKNIFFYDLVNKKNSDLAVPISSVCFVKHLYETRNEKGEFINRNFVENCFSKLEGLFSERRKQLESKAFCLDNLSTNMLLTKEEKAFWGLYVILQALRSPYALQVAKDFGRTNFAEKIGKAKAENLALAFCLPFFEKLTDETPTAMRFLLEPMSNMYMEVGVITDKIGLFTSDNPVFIHCKHWPCEEYDKIIFPISSKLCLFMYGGEEKSGHKSNGLFIIDQATVDEIYWSIAYRAEQRLFSAERILGETRKRVNRAYTQRMTDEKEQSSIV